MNTPAPIPNTRPEIAFYYPGVSWHNSDWVKNLILYFDGIGLLIPQYLVGRSNWLDPAVAAGLQEHGLLHELEPETLIDQAATEELVETMANIVTTGAFDDIAREQTLFRALSFSRLGYYADAGLADMLVTDLVARGLAKFRDDHRAIDVHPVVRSLVLVLLAQILRPYGPKLGVDLSPATDRQEIVTALGELLKLPGPTSTGSVVSLDLETVSVDLGAVPIDEVLAFRKQYASEYRKYARAVKAFARDVSLMSEELREQAVGDRREELRDLASTLRSRSEMAWRKPTSFALALTGSAWKLLKGDPTGVVSGLSSLFGYAPGSLEGGAYTYLFRAQRQFG